MSETHDRLLAVSWKGVHFPITSMRTGLSHALTEHGYWGRDVENVEANGRKSLAITASIPFQLNIQPGQTEKWVQPLYPDGFRKFFAACQKGSTGVLVHPEFGDIKCKVRSVDIDWKGDVRGGVNVEASWVETVEDDEVAKDVLENGSPVQVALFAAGEVDKSFYNLEPKGAYKESLAESLRKLNGAFDQFTVLSAQVGGVVNMVEYRVNAIIDSAHRAQNSLNINLIQNCHRILSAVHDIKRNMLNDRRAIVVYKVPKDMTIAAIAKKTGDSSADIIVMNPALTRSPVVRRGTVVRYFAKAA